jgi:hypothetical protein
MEGQVTKEMFAKAILAHQSANDELKSEQRDRAADHQARNPHLCI